MRRNDRAKYSLIAAVVSLGLLSVGASVRAGVDVGDKPTIAFRTVDGRPVTNERLKGRIVVIDFWATWCGPCMGEAPHMVQLAKDNADKGVVLLGISLDQDIPTMVQTAKANGFTWPQVCDGGVWQSPIAVAWGVNSIPHTFILSPDGVVVWVGHPAMIDQPLADAIAKYPTAGLLRKKATDAVNAALKIMADEKDPTKALAALADVPDGVKPNGDLTALAKKLSGLLATDAGKAALAANTSAEATLKLLSASNVLAASAPVKPATSAGPQISDEVAAARLASAERDQSAKRDIDAYTMYKWIIAHAPSSPAAKEAASHVSDYEADPKFVASYQQTLRNQEASSDLWLAQSLLKAGKTQAAKKQLQEIVDKFGDTPSAAAAKNSLAGLN